MPGSNSKTKIQGIVFNGFRFSVSITTTNARIVTQYKISATVPIIHCIYIAANMTSIS